jgi:hypothetical protein
MFRLLCAALLLCSLVTAAVADEASYAVYINGTRAASPAIVRDGIAYLPAQTVAQSLNVSVRWDSQHNLLRVNNKTLTAAPLTESGRLYVPIEALAAAIGSTVEWDGQHHAIRLFAGAATSPSVTPPISTNPPPAVVLPVPAPAPIEAPPPDATVPEVRAPHPVRHNASIALGSPYIPKTTQNGVFQVTCTNLEHVKTIKDYYRPRQGYQYIIVYLSQQNISDEMQIYTGRFSLVDDQERSYDYLESLSNFFLVILRPYGINFGYLVFEIPIDAQPAQLTLHTVNLPPLVLNL